MESLRDPAHYIPDQARLEKIHAAINAYNVARPKILYWSYLQVFGLLGGFSLVALWLVRAAWNADKEHEMSALIAVGAIAASYHVWKFAWKPFKDHQLDLRYRMFPEIFGFIDRIEYQHDHTPWFVNQLNGIKVVRFRESQTDHVLTGRHDGLDFSLAKTELTSGSGEDKTTVFRGLVLHFKLDTPFPGTLYVSKRGNWQQREISALFGGGGDLLLSGDPLLDETHEFHSDNYDAAKPIVRGPLVRAINWLQREWRDGDVLIALEDRKCFLLLPGQKDLFPLPQATEDIDYDHHVKPMIAEMVTLLAVAHLIRKIG